MCDLFILQVEKTTGKFTKKIDGANLLEIQEFSVTFSAVKKYRLEVARRRVERTCLKLYDENVYMMVGVELNWCFTAYQRN